MSAKETIKRIVDSFNSKPYLKDKTREMGEGLMLGASLADEANERSKEATATTKSIQEKYKEQILAQDLNPNKDPELVDLRNGKATAGERITQFENKTTAQFQQNLYKANYLSNKIKNKDVVDVYIVGDSISAGVGSSGYNLTTTPIFTDKTGVTYYEPNHTSPSWANKLRKYLARVGSISTFFNGAIGGKSAKFFNENKNLYMPDNKDVVFVMLGTNDRVASASPAEFKTNLTELLSHVESKSNFMVVMSANPVKADYDDQGNFTQEEANAVIVDICETNNYLLINHFTETTAKMYAKNYKISDILADNAHPNDKGYALYWDTIQKALGINDTLEYYDELAERPVVMTKYGTYTKDTAPDEFEKGSLLYSLVAGGSSAVEYPENKGGILITDTTTNNVTYYYQYYHIVNENKIYKRAVLSNRLWGTFELLSKFDLQSNNYITNISIPIDDFGGNKIVINTITTTTGLPMARTGTIETIVPSATSKGFAHQSFLPSNNNHKFARSINTTSDAWTDWTQETRNRKMQQFTPVVGTVAAGGTVDVDLTIEGGLNDSFMHTVTVESSIAAGVMWSGFKKNNTTYTIRFHNTTGASVGVGTVIVRYVTLEVIAF